MTASDLPKIVMRRERVHTGEKFLFSHRGGQSPNYNLAKKQE
jgi:hypothetical protein